MATFLSTKFTALCAKWALNSSVFYSSLIKSQLKHHYSVITQENA